LRKSEQARWALFVIEEPAFSFESSAIASERTICADYAVAGNDDGDGVVAVGCSDGSDRRGVTDAEGQIAV